MVMVTVVMVADNALVVMFFMVDRCKCNCKVWNWCVGGHLFRAVVLIEVKNLSFYLLPQIVTHDNAKE